MTDKLLEQIEQITSCPDSVSMIPVGKDMNFKTSCCDYNAIQLFKKLKEGENTILQLGYRTKIIDEKEEGCPHWWVEKNGKVWDINIGYDSNGDFGWFYQVWNIKDYYDYCGIEVVKSFDKSCMGFLDYYVRTGGAT